MKKFLFACACGVSTQAYALENEYRPYVGADYVYSALQTKGTDSYLNSGSLVIGSEYNKFFSTEVFYQKSLTKAAETAAGKMKSALRGYGLDAYAYLPLGCKGRVAPYAAAGIGKYALKKKIAGIKHNDKDGTGYRFGAGINYRVYGNVSLKFGYRYINFDRLSTVDHANEINVGVRYAF